MRITPQSISGRSKLGQFQRPSGRNVLNPHLKEIEVKTEEKRQIISFSIDDDKEEEEIDVNKVTMEDFAKMGIDEESLKNCNPKVRKTLEDMIIKNRPKPQIYKQVKYQAVKTAASNSRPHNGHMLINNKSGRGKTASCSDLF